MQHASNSELMCRMVRAQVCPHCHHRPKGSERFGPLKARSCEPRCAIMLNLPTLEKIATTHANRPGAYDRAIKACICPHCTLCPTAGDFCSERLNQNCPLATFGTEAIQAVEALLAVR